MIATATVLVVEDDQDVREAVVDSLIDAGYGVSKADNGASAINLLEESQDLPCVVLLDLMMPVMDGEQFIQEIRNIPRLAQLPVVILSADARADTSFAALGAQAGLRKPVHLDDLLSVISSFGESAQSKTA